MTGGLRRFCWATHGGPAHRQWHVARTCRCDFGVKSGELAQVGTASGSARRLGRGKDIDRVPPSGLDTRSDPADLEELRGKSGHRFSCCRSRARLVAHVLRRGWRLPADAIQ